jgi:hypothetical protein
MYLVDTNIWLERLLDQEKSDEVGEFLSAVHSDMMGITDFSLHSIGVIPTRLKRPDIFLPFLSMIPVSKERAISSPLSPKIWKKLFSLWRFSIPTLMMHTSTRRQMSMDMFS